MVESPIFDVFLCHNSQDKPEVIEIAQQLQKKGLRPWVDIWELRPGLSWQELLEEQIEQIKSAAVFVGSSGFGPWQKREMRAFLSEFVDRGCPVIPVLLENAPKKPKLPIFLKAMTWVDFKSSYCDPMEQLIWGITGKKPDKFNASPQIIIPSDQSFKFEVITVNDRGQEVKREQGQAQYYTEDLGNGVTLDMVKIPGGSFMMGTEESEIERLCQEYDAEWFREESPQHQVSIPRFFMGSYPITQAQWREVAGWEQVERELDADPSYFKEDYEDIDRWLRPVESISWEEAKEFCARLSNKTKREYRLPTEAEWEYGCRAGTITPFHFGETISTELANYRGTDWKYEGKVYPGNYGRGLKGICREQTTPVGYFKVANNFGLCEMHGNVWELCQDDWHKNYEGAPTDGSAWISGDNSSTKVVRGSSWDYNPHYCRSACRFGSTRAYRHYAVGFRVACVVPSAT